VLIFPESDIFKNYRNKEEEGKEWDNVEMHEKNALNRETSYQYLQQPTTKVIMRF